MHAIPRGGQASHVVETGMRAGHCPAGSAELFRQFPVWGGPDILGMGGTGPGHPRDDTGVRCDRGGRVDEMGMKPLSAIRPFMGEHQRLSEPAEAVWRRIRAQIGPELLQERLETGPRYPGEKTAEHSQRLLIEIFGQV